MSHISPGLPHQPLPSVEPRVIHVVAIAPNLQPLRVLLAHDPELAIEELSRIICGDKMQPLVHIRKLLGTGNRSSTKLQQCLRHCTVVISYSHPLSDTGEYSLMCPLTMPLYPPPEWGPAYPLLPIAYSLRAHVVLRDRPAMQHSSPGSKLHVFSTIPPDQPVPALQAIEVPFDTSTQCVMKAWYRHVFPTAIMTTSEAFLHSQLTPLWTQPSSKAPFIRWAVHFPPTPTPGFGRPGTLGGVIWDAQISIILSQTHGYAAYLEAFGSDYLVFVSDTRAFNALDRNRRRLLSLLKCSVDIILLTRPPPISPTTVILE